MKKYPFYITLLAALAAGFSACDDDPETTLPGVTLEAGSATASTITFTLTPQDATQAAYTVVKKGASLPDAAAVFTQGTSTAGDKPQTCTASGLTAGTEYVVVAAARYGEAFSQTTTLEMATLGAPTLQLTAVEAGYDVLTFSVTCSPGTDRAAYVCIPKGEALPVSPKELLADGNAFDPGSDKVTAKGLRRATTYVIAVAVASGTAASEMATLEMTTTETFETEATNIYGAYFGNVFLSPDSKVGHYQLNLADVELIGGGQVKGAGYIFSLVFYSDLYPRKDRNAVPAAGEYHLGGSQDSPVLWALDNQSSQYGQTDEEGNYLDRGTFSAATLKIANPSEGVYEIDALVECGGQKVHMLWSGPLAWENRTIPLAQDLEFTPSYVSLIYYGPTSNDPTIDSWLIEISDDKDNPQAYISVPFYARNADNPSEAIIPAGTYTVGEPEGCAAGTFIPGGKNTGGAFFHGDTGDGIWRELYLLGGSFTVGYDGENYTIECHLETSDESLLTTRFTGVPDQFYSYYAPPIQDGLVVNATGVAGDKASFYYGYGDTNTYIVQLIDCDFGTGFTPVGGQGNEMTLSIYSDVTPADLKGEIDLPVGTYTFADSHADGTFGSFCYHWGENGKLLIVHASAGTLTIERVEDNYIIKLEGTTDDGQRYACFYTGPISFKDSAS